MKGRASKVFFDAEAFSALHALRSIMADLCKLAGNVEQNYGLCCSRPSAITAKFRVGGSGGVDDEGR